MRVLARHLAQALPAQGAVLDVGCGDGLLDSLILRQRPGLRIEGIDVLQRPASHIPVKLFDGRHIPHPDQAFDAVMLVDVLHHTEQPQALLAEACRVARHSIVLKDHLLSGWLAGPTLRLMDWVGNAPHGVALPYHFLRESEWREMFAVLGLQVETWQPRLHLYPPPATWLFDRSLHFVAVLRKSS